MKQQIING